MNCNKCFFSKPCDRMKIIRGVLRIKRDIFCKYMGISPTTLYFWENKKIILTDEQKRKFRYVGINPQWIDYGTGDPFILNQNTVADNIIKFKQ